MKPPECCICGKDLRMVDEGELVYFEKTTSDIEWDKMMEEKDWTGHPPYAEWFCGEHYPKAKELQNLEIAMALEILKKD